MVYIGQAVDEAASWHEKGEEIGIFYTPSARLKLDEEVKKEFDKEMKKVFNEEFNEEFEKEVSEKLNKKLLKKIDLFEKGYQQKQEKLFLMIIPWFKDEKNQNNSLKL